MPTNILTPAFSLKAERRRHAEADRRQGLIGWVNYSERTGVVLCLHRSLDAAERSRPELEERFGYGFRTLGLHSSGRAYEHVDGRATRQAVTSIGEAVYVPVNGRRLRRRGATHARLAR